MESNIFEVRTNGVYITIGRPKNTMTRQEALNLAAHIILLVNDDAEFERICENMMPERMGV